MSDDTTYAEAIILDGIFKSWPHGREVPQLLRDFAAYVHPQEWGKMGHFHMGGRFSRLNDFWACNGEDLWPYFGTVIRVPNGTLIGQWFEDGPATPTQGAPVVRLSDEEYGAGGTAPDLETCLALWLSDAMGIFGIVAEDKEAFRQFLQARLGGTIPTVKEEWRAYAQHGEKADAFLMSWEDTQNAALRADPDLQEIASLLADHVPRVNEWDYFDADIHVVGDRCEITQTIRHEDRADRNEDPFEYRNIPHEAKIIPLVLKLREARASGIHKPRGLWHRARLRVKQDGFCWIPAYWADPPVFKDGTSGSVEDYLKDLKRFPRAPRWQEDWLPPNP